MSQTTLVIVQTDPAVDPGAGARPEQGELMEADLAVSACGKALDDAGLGDTDLRPGIERGSMKALAGWAAMSDTLLTF